MKLARYATRRPAFLAFTGSFHGRNLRRPQSDLEQGRQHSGFGPFLPEVYHVPFAYCYRCAYGKSPADCALHCVRQIEDDLFARQVDPNDVAAIFVEPIQGEGGYIVPPDEFLPALRALCDRHGILLVCDEGCRVGGDAPAGCSRRSITGVEPDIITVAKGSAPGSRSGPSSPRNR